MKLRWGYGLAALGIFAVEVLIFLYMRDGFVRPYLGDVLAVILVYLGLRAVTPLRVLPAALLTCLIALAIELSQFFRLTERLGLSGQPVAHAVLGSSFDFKDLLCYAAGIALVILVEAARRQHIR